MVMKSPAGAPEPRSSAPKQPLSPAMVRALRARAHALKPVVRIAASGPTEGMVRELDRALAAHELVKIHAAGEDREERARLLLALCEQLDAQPVQTIGKMLVAYRPRPPAEEKPQAPQRRAPGRRGAGNARAGKKPPGRATPRRAKPAASSNRGRRR